MSYSLEPVLNSFDPDQDRLYANCFRKLTTKDNCSRDNFKAQNKLFEKKQSIIIVHFYHNL